MNLGRHMVHQPYHGSFETIHYPIRQVHQNPRVLGHVLLVIHCTKASQSNYYIITTGKLNADWSNKQYLQHNKSCNKASSRLPGSAQRMPFGPSSHLISACSASLPPPSANFGLL